MKEPKRSVEDDLIDDWNIDDAYWQSVFDVDDADIDDGTES
mgnify:CR=1 FL=1|tara:strand:- start:9743 stop:9865 length:123 start_codon:yes stop_codon:yes gene_type:complete